MGKSEGVGKCLRHSGPRAFEKALENEHSPYAAPSPVKEKFFSQLDEIYKRSGETDGKNRVFMPFMAIALKGAYSPEQLYQTMFDNHFKERGLGEHPKWFFSNPKYVDQVWEDLEDDEVKWLVDPEGKMEEKYVKENRERLLEKLWSCD